MRVLGRTSSRVNQFESMQHVSSMCIFSTSINKVERICILHPLRCVPSAARSQAMRKKPGTFLAKPAKLVTAIHGFLSSSWLTRPPHQTTCFTIVGCFAGNY